MSSWLLHLISFALSFELALESRCALCRGKAGGARPTCTGLPLATYEQRSTPSPEEARLPCQHSAQNRWQLCAFAQPTERIAVGVQRACHVLWTVKTLAHSRREAISAASAFMAGVLPVTCMMACKVAVESDWNDQKKGWSRRRGNHVSIASNAASNSYSDCQAESPRSARNKLKSSSSQSPASHAICTPLTKRMAPNPHGEASVRKAMRFVADRAMTSVHLCTLSLRSSVAMSPLMSNLTKPAPAGFSQRRVDQVVSAWTTSSSTALSRVV